jgi:EpsI family protein
MVAGVLAALVAAWIPARQAASVDPTKVLHPGTAPEIFPMPALPLALCGVGVLLLGFFCSLGALFGGLALLGFGAAFFVLAGFSLMVPMVAVAAAGLLRRLLAQPLLKRGAILRIALEQTMRSLHRTAPTISALAAAAAMTVGISVMIHSFRGSVIAWTGRTLTADLFIAVYDRQSEGRELIGFGQGAEGLGDVWSWIEGCPAPANGRCERISSRHQHRREVLSFYRVGGVTSGSAAAIKLATMKARLTGGDQQSVAILVSSEQAGKQSPRPTMDAFVKSVGDIDKLADRMAGLD